MKVARLYGVGDLRVGDEPAPAEPDPGQVLIRVTAVGICGSDLHWFGEGGIGDAGVTEPLVLGHECAGVIASGPRTGTRVAIDPAIPCERCESCRRGYRNLCPDVRFAGHSPVDGGLQELLVWPDHLLHPLPDSVSDADGAMLEPLGVALHAIDLGRVRLASRVAIVGCGPIGLLAIQLARAAGATYVIAVEPLEHRREAALHAGADAVLTPDEAGVQPHDVDVAIEISGTDDAVNLALLAARPGGRVVLAGIPDRDETLVRASVARRKGLSVLMARRMNETYPRSIALVQRGLVDLASVVTHTFPLDRAPAAFAHAAARAGLKTVVEPAAERSR